MLSNHNSGPSMMPGLTGMEGSDVDGNDVTGINSNLYPPSSVSGDDTGKSMVCWPERETGSSFRLRNKGRIALNR